MSDIVERLRNAGCLIYQDEAKIPEAQSLMERAADEIERLRAALQMIIDEAARDGSSPRGHYIARAALHGHGEKE